MIRSLRWTHNRIFLVAALILPLLLVAALWVRRPVPVNPVLPVKESR